MVCSMLDSVSLHVCKPLYFSVTMKVMLSELEAGVKVDEWYSLCPVNITNKVEGGSIRVSVRYLHEIIMPLKEYTSLKEV